VLNCIVDFDWVANDGLASIGVPFETTLLLRKSEGVSR